jgi:hypothetical protein
LVTDRQRSMDMARTGLGHAEIVVAFAKDPAA